MARKKIFCVVLFCFPLHLPNIIILIHYSVCTTPTEDSNSQTTGSDSQNAVHLPTLSGPHSFHDQHYSAYLPMDQSGFRYWNYGQMPFQQSAPMEMSTHQTQISENMHNNLGIPFLNNK